MNNQAEITRNRSFVERNRAATDRIRALARLSEQELQLPVGEHWTVAITLAHVAFWDQRLLHVLDTLERSGEIQAPGIDVAVNDVLLPFWAAIPARDAARLAVETAQTLDSRLEELPLALLEKVYAFYDRWVLRDLHRNEHLDEAEAALGG